MKIGTTYDLQTLTRAQLLALQEEALALLANLELGSAAHADLLALLADIRAVLAGRGLVRRGQFRPPTP